MSRKAGKAQQLSLRCSVSVPHARRLGELAGMEERCHFCSQKSFESKDYAAREEPHSSHPATPAQFCLSVPPY